MTSVKKQWGNWGPRAIVCPRLHSMSGLLYSGPLVSLSATSSQTSPLLLVIITSLVRILCLYSLIKELCQCAAAHSTGIKATASSKVGVAGEDRSSLVTWSNLTMFLQCLFKLSTVIQRCFKKRTLFSAAMNTYTLLDNSFRACHNTMVGVINSGYPVKAWMGFGSVWLHIM